MRVDYKKFEVVKDKRLLNKMAKAGLIKLHPQTGVVVRHVMGGTIKAWYVDDVPSIFDFNGEKYGGEYFSGCFCPFVVKYKTYEDTKDHSEVSG
jgi:hypothetical protein